MGKAIEEIALGKGHEIVLKINIDNTGDFTEDKLKKADVAIEFSGPEAAASNIMKCLNAGVPVVSGSTGWLKSWEEIKQFCDLKKGTLLYASNFSIGVNLFFELNDYLAALMSKYAAYNAELEEIHHTQKKDAPSGTAISLADQILKYSTLKKHWVNDLSDNSEDLSIISKRIDPAPGTHIIKYTSAVDDIEIKHTAHNRSGFASGALQAAEYVSDKKGIFTMKDVLGL